MGTTETKCSPHGRLTHYPFRSQPLIIAGSLSDRRCLNNSGDLLDFEDRWRQIGRSGTSRSALCGQVARPGGAVPFGNIELVALWATNGGLSGIDYTLSAATMCDLLKKSELSRFGPPLFFKIVAQMFHFWVAFCEARRIHRLQVLILCYAKLFHASSVVSGLDCRNVKTDWNEVSCSSDSFKNVEPR